MKNTEHDAVAHCRLLLKGSHWVPLSMSTRLSAANRSRPDGPVVSASLVATLKDGVIVSWANSDFQTLAVGPDGTIEPEDISDIALMLEASGAEAKVPANVAVLGRQRLKRQQSERHQSVSSELRRAAFERAAIQIMDKVHGVKAVGVLIAAVPPR